MLINIHEHLYRHKWSQVECEMPIKGVVVVGSARQYKHSEHHLNFRQDLNGKSLPACLNQNPAEIELKVEEVFSIPNAIL